MNLVIFGFPGSGKGTQARLLAEYYSLAIVDTGLLLRDVLKKFSSKEYELMNKGNLLDDNVVITTVREHLLNLTENFILDGFPRTIQQAYALEEILSWRKQKLTAVIKLLVREEVIVERLFHRVLCEMCGAILVNTILHCPICNNTYFIRRKDDNMEAIERRIEQYKVQEKKLLDFYTNKLIIINGEQAVSQVTADIKKSLLDF